MVTDEHNDAVAVRVRRDALGQFCFLVHFAAMIFIVAAWAVPLRPVLVFYLAFLPAVVLQWQFNRNSCVLNNLESLIRTGRWRDATNPEEGAWLMTLANRTLGLELTPRQMDGFVYLVMLLLWGLGLAHLLRV